MHWFTQMHHKQFKWKTITILLSITALLFSPISSFAMEGDEKHIVAHAQYDPTVQDHYQDQIAGSSWDIGSWVTLEIDDPSNGPGVDYSAGQTAKEKEAEGITADFLLGEFDLKPGHIITMSDGTTTRTHVVQPQEITSIDVESDTITGTAPEGSEVLVWFENPGFHELIVEANEDDI